jgi:predicted nucleic acid-binding protein
MVIAYALLGVAEFRDEAMRAIEAAQEIWVPDSCRAELVNIVWQWVQYRDVALETGIEVLWDAETLFTQVVPTPAIWDQALALAVEREHPAYDTLFVALAAVQGSLVVTYDSDLIKKFPKYSISVPDFLDRSHSE